MSVTLRSNNKNLKKKIIAGVHAQMEEKHGKGTFSAKDLLAEVQEKGVEISLYYLRTLMSELELSTGGGRGTWSETDVAYLVENYGTISAPEMGIALGKSTASIQYKLSALRAKGKIGYLLDYEEEGARLASILEGVDFEDEIEEPV